MLNCLVGAESAPHSPHDRLLQPWPLMSFVERRTCAETPKSRAASPVAYSSVALRSAQLLQESRHDPAPRREEADRRQCRKPVSGQRMNARRWRRHALHRLMISQASNGPALGLLAEVDAQANAPDARLPNQVGTVGRAERDGHGIDLVRHIRCEDRRIEGAAQNLVPV